MAHAVPVAPDGSVWFGEEAVPALAHFFVTNGTLVEFLSRALTDQLLERLWMCRQDRHLGCGALGRQESGRPTLPA